MRLSGFCRLFPLGRYYTEDGFKYIIQIHECAKKNRSKIKVKKWIDTPDLRQYEKFVWDWHQFLLDVQEVFYQTEDADLIKNLNMYVLSRFYTKSYEENRDFYEQFYERLEEAKKLLKLGMIPGREVFLNEKLLIIFCKEFDQEADEWSCLIQDVCNKEQSHPLASGQNHDFPYQYVEYEDPECR